MSRFSLVLLLIIALFLATATMAQAQPPEVVATVQERLIQKGYHPGRVDGVWGRKSIEALRRYQLDQGLAATGRLNPPTARSLDISLPALPGEAEGRPPGPPREPDGPPRPPGVRDLPPRPQY